MVNNLQSGLTYREIITAQLNGFTVQYRLEDETSWSDAITIIAPLLDNLDDYPRDDLWRIKPQVRKCNGVVLDECAVDALPHGTDYYEPSPLLRKGYVRRVWTDSSVDYYKLAGGFVYLSIEAALKHSNAMAMILVEV